MKSKAHIIEQANVFSLAERTEVAVAVGTGTVREALREWKGAGFQEFAHPAVLLVDGTPVLRERWDEPGLVREGSTINVMALPAAPALSYVFYAVLIVSVAYSVYVAQKAAKRRNPADLPQADPIYTLGAEKNSAKLGQPIEVAYGRNRIYPSFAARPFNRYIDGEQYLYQLFCIGQGDFQVEGVYIEDTLIDNFRDVTHQVYAPGQQATLFPDNVVTAVEVSNLEMFGTNESQHVTYGPYTLNPRGTVTNLIEVDITLPNGLYRLTDEGDVSDLSLSYLFEIRQVDDNDQPITDWTHFDSATLTYRSVNPIRLTKSHDVSPGRYQLRGRRTSQKDNSSRAANTLIWESARAFLPSTRNYGNVTLLAVAMKATNNLNDNSQNRVNVVCTRKIPVWNGSTWSVRATRSAIWAFADIVRAHYGARLTQQYLDLPKMLQLDQLLASRGDYFDYVFTQKTTIWEALGTAALVGRCEPLLLGPKFTIVRDEPKVVPVGVFTPDNIVEGSFEWDIEYFDPLEHDSVEVTYIDVTTWKEMVVRCVPPGSPGTNPEKWRLHGCANRTSAYREGMYRAMTSLKRRETVTFTTGLEGVIPLRGDLIAVSYDLPNWGSAGTLQDLGLDNRTLYLDNAMTWVPGVTYSMLLRLDDGSGYGPFTVTRGANNAVAVAGSDIDASMFSKAVGREPILYLFGPVDKVFKTCLVREVQPQGGEHVTVRAVNYDPSVFDYDEAVAPPVDGGQVPPKVPDLPEVPYIQANPVPTNLRQVMAVWGVALGAKTYLLQKSLDGVSWSDVVVTASTSFTIDVEPGELFLRVSGINVGAGPFAYWSGTVGIPTSKPSNVPSVALSYPFTGMQAVFRWPSVFGADYYRVRVYDEWDDLLFVTTSDVTSFTLDYNDVYARNVVRRTYKVKVVAVNELGESDVPAEVVATNPIPAKPQNLGVVVVGDTAADITYRGSWTPVQGTDIRAYIVWASPIAGFTPSGANKIFEGLATAIDIKVPKSGGAVPLYYWRVAAVDYWGDEYTISDQATTS